MNQEQIIWRRTKKEPVLSFITGEVPYLEFPTLKETGIVHHCFSTRLGGVSKGIYNSMNLSYTRGDEDAAVTENFRRMAGAIKVDPENYVFTHQTHTTNVRTVTKADSGKGFSTLRDYDDVDGLITNVPNLVLATFYADCVPLYFVDPINKAIGLSHSGWRGTVGRMGKVTIEKMVESYGTDPADLIVAIGPSICQGCYEVSEDVASEFYHEFTKEQGKEILLDKGNGKYQLDLWKANEIILLEAGVKEDHISTTDICTCCNHELLFSHRASEGRRGNLAALLSLKG